MRRKRGRPSTKAHTFAIELDSPQDLLSKHFGPTLYSVIGDVFKGSTKNVNIKLGFKNKEIKK